MPSITKTLLSLLFLGYSSAHTWNEQLAVIGPDGRFTGPYGYSRGYVSRTAPNFNNGLSMQHLLPSLESERLRINNSDLLCKSGQRRPIQSPGYPRLQVAPGSWVAMKYLENGHVTEPWFQPGKPPKAGTAFVYGTTAPHEYEKIATVLLWNRDGTGGDGRGRLLAANNVDDGRCHQINTSPLSVERQQWDPDPFPGQPGTVSEQWCETNVQMPSNLTVGQPLTIYWVWQWPTSPGAPGLPDGKDEYYTTCSDFDVVAKEPSGPISNTLSIQDPQTLAVSNYKSRPAITTMPNLEYDPIDGLKTSSIPSTTLTPPPTPAAVYVPTGLSTPASELTQTAPSVVPLSSSASAPMSPTTTAYVPPAPTVSTPVDSAPVTSITVPAVPAVPSPPAAATPTPVILTAVVTVTATMAPSQSMLVVRGSHVVTFSNPQMTLTQRAEHSGLVPVYRRRAVVRGTLLGMGV